VPQRRVRSGLCFSNLIVKQLNKTKWYTAKVLLIVLVQMHFIQCKNFKNIRFEDFF